MAIEWNLVGVVFGEESVGERISSSLCREL